MRLELPELKRCCFCLPLRYGLIMWGYIKLAILLLLGVMVSILLGDNLHYLLSSSITIQDIIEDIVLTCLLVLLIFVDICFTIVFIVGGHKKSARLFYSCYIYSIVLLCLFTLLSTWEAATELTAIWQDVEDTPHGLATLLFIHITKAKLLVTVVIIGIEVYITLLIRSEIRKLKNKSEYRLGNPTAVVL